MSEKQIELQLTSVFNLNMKFIIILISSLFFSGLLWAMDMHPSCRAQLRNEFGAPVTEVEWQEQVFIRTLEGDLHRIKISTSVGDQHVMSLWVRNELEEPKPHGFFTFVQFMPNKEEKFWFYLDTGYSVEIACHWN